MYSSKCVGMILMVDFPTLVQACLNSIHNLVDCIFVMNGSCLPASLVHKYTQLLGIKCQLFVFTAPPAEFKYCIPTMQLQYKLYEYACNKYLELHPTNQVVFLYLNAYETLSIPADSNMFLQECCSALCQQKEQGVYCMNLKVGKFQSFLHQTFYNFNIVFEPRLFVANLSLEQFSSCIQTSKHTFVLNIHQLVVCPSLFEPTCQEYINDTFVYVYRRFRQTFNNLFDLHLHNLPHQSSRLILTNLLHQQDKYDIFVDFANVVYIICSNLENTTCDNSSNLGTSNCYLAPSSNPLKDFFNYTFKTRQQEPSFTTLSWIHLAYKCFKVLTDINLQRLSKESNPLQTILAVHHLYTSYVCGNILHLQIPKLIYLLQQLVYFVPYHIDANTHLIALHMNHIIRMRVTRDGAVPLPLRLEKTTKSVDFNDEDRRNVQLCISRVIDGLKAFKCPSFVSLQWFMYVFKQFHVSSFDVISSNVCPRCKHVLPKKQYLGWLFPCLHMCCVQCYSQICCTTSTCYHTDCQQLIYGFLPKVEVEAEA